MSPISRRSLLISSALFPQLLRAVDPPTLKISITSDEVDDDLDVAVAFLKRFELSWVEIRNLAGKYNTSQPLETIRAARKTLDAAGVKTAILDTGFFKIPLPADDAAGRAKLDEQWALLDRAFERAEIFGTDKIRSFAFTHARGEQPNPEHYPRIYELVAESARRAKKRGFRLALENVGGSYVATAEQASKLLAAVKEEALGLTWDPNNSAGSGDPEPFPAGFKKLDAARIIHVHLRDYRRTPDGGAEWCGVGEGEFDHVGQIRALLKAGYKEAFSLETHYRIDGSKAKASAFSMTALLERFRKV